MMLHLSLCHDISKASPSPTLLAIILDTDSQIDQSGKLGFDEFRQLWEKLRELKGVFKKYDSDSSGQFNSYELRQALMSMGLYIMCRLTSLTNEARTNEMKLTVSIILADCDS